MPSRMFRACCRGACTVCRVIWDNVNAGQTRHERVKRGVKCIVAFLCVVLFFNSYVVSGKFSTWEKNPGGK